MLKNMADMGHYYTKQCIIHHKDGSTETVDVQCIKLAQMYDFVWGNVIKYLWRYRGKNGLEDLYKALDYAESAAIEPSDGSRGSGDALHTQYAIIYGITEAGNMSPEEAHAWLSILEGNRDLVVEWLKKLIYRVESE